MEGVALLKGGGGLLSWFLTSRNVVGLLKTSKDRGRGDLLQLWLRKSVICLRTVASVSCI